MDGCGQGPRLNMLVLHDDDERATRTARRWSPDSKVGAFTLGLYDEAKKKDWIVISMKKDWKVVFPFER